MLLRSILAFALLWLQLCGCTASNSSAVDQLDRRHDELMKTMSGGGGGM
jgi:hypothetical protein